MTKTTKAHFKIFKEECLKWQRELGLMNYRIYIKHKTDAEDSFGSISYGDLENYNASIYLSTDWGESEITEHQLKRTAFHEICHLLTHRLLICSKARFLALDEIDEAEHEIVRRLENLMFKDD